MSDFQGLYDIRSAVTDDYNFIVATWLRGYYYGNDFKDESGHSLFSYIDKASFMRDYKKLVNAILTNPKVNIRVACLKEDPNVILGYSVTTKDDRIIFWTFVKTAWRQQGIGKSLLPKDPKVAVSCTNLGLKLMSKYPNLKFNPFELA